MIFFTDVGDSGLIKELPPGTIYARFVKRTGNTYNVIGQYRMLFNRRRCSKMYSVAK